MTLPLNLLTLHVSLQLLRVCPGFLHFEHRRGQLFWLIGFLAEALQHCLSSYFAIVQIRKIHCLVSRLKIYMGYHTLHTVCNLQLFHNNSVLHKQVGDSGNGRNEGPQLVIISEKKCSAYK